MKTKFLVGAGLLTAGAIVWAAKDPVVMKINGVDVPKSEFEYLYYKNSAQQTEPQTLDEYVEMFKLYKLKVADARQAGIDTTLAFVDEMAQYRRDLAMPYVADSAFLKTLVDEAFERSRNEVQANHIMIAKGRNAKENNAAKFRIDSIRQALLSGANFEELARTYSDDRSAASNSGHMGYIVAGRLPYDFEVAAFSLKPGEISEIVESNTAYHVLVGGEKRPAQGSVKASHIMKMVRPGSSPETEYKAHEEIDSIYHLLMEDPSQFEAIARKESDDKNSAAMNGTVGWFTSGMMVPEFENEAFALNVGEISHPVRSMYGWHIIRKDDRRGPQTYDEVKADILSKVANAKDERYKIVRDQQNERLAKKFKGSIDRKTVDNLKSYIAMNGLDSAFYASNANNKSAIYTVAGHPTTVAEFTSKFMGTQNKTPDPYVGGVFFDERLAFAYTDALLNAEEDWLEANNADYRNLMNEYREGSLMYEVSRQKVWDKAANDVAGLEKYFETHRDDYTWSEPKAKGILIQARNDEVAEKVKQRYLELPKDSASQMLRNEFRSDIIVDRVLAPKGLNRLVDYLMFNGPEPQPNAQFPVYFILDPRVLAAPEEMNDVRGQVTSDYQNQLNDEWVIELQKKYPVEVYMKELKNIK